MDQNKLRKLAGLAAIVENSDLRNNANFLSRMHEKFVDVDEEINRINMFAASADFKKFITMFDKDAAEDFDLSSTNIGDIIFEIRENLTDAQFALSAIYQICSGTNPQ